MNKTFSKKSTIIILIALTLFTAGLAYGLLILSQKDNNLSWETLINHNEPVVINGEIDTSGWETYRNEEYGWEIKYPKDWTKNEDQNMRFSEGGLEGKGIGFISPKECIHEIPCCNVFVYIFDYDSKYPPFNFYKEKIHSGDGTFVTEKQTEEIVLGKNQENFIKITTNHIDYITIKDGKYFEIKIDNFGNQIEEEIIINNIINSFKFIK